VDMRDSFEGMRQGLKNFKRYVPADLVAQLINENLDAGLGGEVRPLTIFFSDIADFTTISEQKTPEELVADLSQYFEISSKSILERRGTIDKYIGDSVMAFWGAPEPMADHAARACDSAIAIRDSLRTLSRQWENQGKEPFRTRIGIHTGEAIVGNMGYADRLNYTVIGDAVNVASRLEGINKVYGTEIVVSRLTYDQCRGEFEFRLLDRVSVKGRREPLDIFELAARKNDLDKRERLLYRYYEAGMKRYLAQEWDEALRYFDTVLRYRRDRPAMIMRERCLAYRVRPPGAGWNGVSAQTTK